MIFSLPQLNKHVEIKSGFLSIVFIPSNFSGKKVRTASTKRRPKVSADQVNGGGGGRTPLSAAAAAVTPEQTSSITADWITGSDGTNSRSSSSHPPHHHFQPNVQQQQQYTDQELLRDYVSIGKHRWVGAAIQRGHNCSEQFPSGTHQHYHF